MLVLKKICPVSVLSFACSVLAFVLYAMLLGGIDVYFIWIISSIAALCLPILAKRIRKKKGSKGKALEIIALILGAFDFYFVIFAATKWNINIAFALIAAACVMYAKMFNQINGEAQGSANEEISASATIAEEGNAPTATVEDPKPPETKKQRYCKFCGGAIDGNTKKCTKCGKQYFRIKSVKHVICYTFLIGIVLSLLCVIYVRDMQHAEAYSKLNEEKENLSVIIKNKDIEIDSLETVASQLRSALSSARIQISFFDKHVVFVSDDGTRLYHKYECDNFDTSHFWAFNTEAAINKGYKQCPECH